MRSDSTFTSALSRRRALRVGVGTATGLALRSAPHPSLAQAPTNASPISGADYSRPEMLVDADWMAEHQDDPAVVMVGFMPAEDFAEGHIAGSVQLDWPVLEVIDTSDASIERWRDQTVQMLSSLGVTRNHTVAAYDAGTLFAARLWWVLHYLGHDDVRVMNGGLAAWQEAAGEITTDAAPTPSAASPATDSFQTTPKPDVLAQLDAVWASLDDPDVAIVDARTPDEYAEGHIPGAVNINYPRNALVDAPKFWKPADELRAMYEAVGISDAKRVVPYCSTGVRSAVTWFTLRLIGYEEVALYTGSWKEWGDHPETPKTIGDQP
jgi:thiosulfate/3-mercaptopyruvate sulfurtransferase